MNQAVPPNFDATHFRQALSRFATGVTVITTRANDAASPPAFVGITASSFNSVSLHPPLVLWSLSSRASSLPLFHQGSHYVVNVLAADQMNLCEHFATVKGDRFAGVPYSLSRSGVPILHGALAWFECHNRSRYAEGDHVIFVGEVERCGFVESGQALVFQGGRLLTMQDLSVA